MALERDPEVLQAALTAMAGPGPRATLPARRRPTSRSANRADRLRVLQGL